MTGHNHRLEHSLLNDCARATHHRIRKVPRERKRKTQPLALLHPPGHSLFCVFGGPGAVPGGGAGVCPGGHARPRRRAAGAGVGARGPLVMLVVKLLS